MANDGTVKIGAEVDEKSFKSSISKLSSVAGSAFSKIGKAAKVSFIGTTAAIGAASTAIGGLAKAATSAYASYEQLTGGVETLFKDSSDLVMKYANDAYKTAGLSANQYMETVTSFSASLLQSLGGDTKKAAETADKAIIDMADNANKMGTSMESIQYAYQGFAKQNYTMLDNLKIGYGGTKQEMERLLADAEKLAGRKFDLSSFADIVEAIHVVQEQMGITGTTAEEAATTIEGSINSMKAAWENFITGMADGSQDIGQLTENLVDSVITVMNNLVPRLQEFLPRLTTGLAELIQGLLPYIPDILGTLLPALIDGATALVNGVAAVLPEIISTVIGAMPQLLDAGMQILYTLGAGMMNAIPQLLDGVVQIVDYLANALINALPAITEKIPAFIGMFVGALIDAASILTETGPEIIGYLAEGLSRAILKFTSMLPDIVGAISDFITTNLPALADAAVLIIRSLAFGLSNNLPEIIPVIYELIYNIVDVLTRPDVLVPIIKAAGQIMIALWQGLINAMPIVIERIPQIVANLARSFLEGIPAIVDAAVQIAKAFVDGISDTITGLATGLFTGITEILTGKTIRSGSVGGGGSRRTSGAARSAPAAESEPAAFSLAAEDGTAMSRASMLRSLESAIPEAAGRVSIATASMTPATAYSAPSPVNSGGNAGNGQPVQIIDRRPIVIKAEGDLAPLARLFKPALDAENIRVGSGV